MIKAPRDGLAGARVWSDFCQEEDRRRKQAEAAACMLRSFFVVLSAFRC